MPKMKTRKIVAKRFKITKTGKVKRRTANTAHNARKDTAGAKMRKRRDKEVKGRFAKKIKKLLGKA